MPLQIDGVRGLVDGTRPRRHGVRVATTGTASVAVECCIAAVDWGMKRPGDRSGPFDQSRRIPRPDGRVCRRRRLMIVDDSAPARDLGRWEPRVGSRVAGSHARHDRDGAVGVPRMCLVAVPWKPDRLQGSLDGPRRGGMGGEWGTIYYDDDGCSGRCSTGPLTCSPCADLPAGPPSDDAMLVDLLP